MTRLAHWLTTLLAPLRLFREQAERARRELERQPRAMTAPVERRGPGTFEPSALDPSEVRVFQEYDREGRPREVVEVFRRNEGG